MVAQVADLQLLYGLYNQGRNQKHIVLNIAERLERIEQQRRRRAQQGRGFPVTIRPSGSSIAAAGAPVCSAFFQRGAHTGPVVRRNARKLHEQLYFVHFFRGADPLALLYQRAVIAAYDLVVGGAAHGFVVNNAVPAIFTPISVGDL